MGAKTQQNLLATVAFREANGIEFGVLEDGTPYMSSRGLAKVCGVAPGVIITLTSNWHEEANKPRGEKISELIQRYDGDDSTLVMESDVQGRRENVHPEHVVMAIIEYYAFEVAKEQAVQSYRTLGRYGFRTFAYKVTGYRSPYDVGWDYYRFMKENNPSPAGYFDVFNELGELLLKGMRAGVTLSQYTVPDGSCGIHWAKHWTTKDLNATYGERVRMPHEYPPDYPQSAATIEKWAYPKEALGVFHVWLEQVYLPTKFPTYLRKKLSAEDAAVAIDAIVGELLIGIE